MTIVRSTVEEAVKYHLNTSIMHFLKASAMDINKQIQEAEKATKGGKIGPHASALAWRPYTDKIKKAFEGMVKISKANA